MKVLVLDAGAFLLPMHLQNLPQIGFHVPRPLAPSEDPGSAREIVWGMPWRSNTEFIGQAYCLGGKSLYWGGWCPRLLGEDLAQWPPSVAQYLKQNYSLLEQQTGVDVKTDFIQGALFELIKTQIGAAVQAMPGLNLDAVEAAARGAGPIAGMGPVQLRQIQQHHRPHRSGAASCGSPGFGPPALRGPKLPRHRAEG